MVCLLIYIISTGTSGFLSYPRTLFLLQMKNLLSLTSNPIHNFAEEYFAIQVFYSSTTHIQVAGSIPWVVTQAFSLTSYINEISNWYNKNIVSFGPRKIQYWSLLINQSEFNVDCLYENLSIKICQ